MQHKGVIPQSPLADAKKLHEEGKYKKSAEMYEEAAGQALSLGHTRTAAGLYRAAAEEYTTRAIERGKGFSRAYGAYGLAISYYDQSERKESANECRIELAKLYETQKKYIEALGLYYEIGDQESARRMWRNSEIEEVQHE